MKKKEYLAPTMKVFKLQQQHHLLAGSPSGTNVFGSDYAEDEYETL